MGVVLVRCSWHQQGQITNHSKNATFPGAWNSVSAGNMLQCCHVRGPCVKACVIGECRKGALDNA